MPKKLLPSPTVPAFPYRLPSDTELWRGSQCCSTIQVTSSVSAGHKHPHRAEESKSRLVPTVTGSSMGVSISVYLR